MADQVGRYQDRQFGNYRLVRLLGEGGFAEVYLGEHIHLGTYAAIKILHTQLSQDDVDKFRTEARTIARLIHPNIVRVLEFGIEGKTPFLAMDYAPNGTLRQRHSKGVPLSLPIVLSYVKQLAEALQCAHDEKLIHRDIKPENMLLGRRNEVLLSDFGIALVAQSSRYQSTQDMTGTIAYMAPEQIQGKPRPASDQYSLGIVVYEWLSGERPFHGGFTEIVAQHLAIPPMPLHQKVPTLPLTIDQAVMRALEKDPHKRFESIQAFAAALEQVSQTEIPTVVKPSPSVVQAPPVTPRKTPSPVQPPPVKPPLPPTLPVAQTKPTGTILSTYHGHSATVIDIAWSPDSKRLASAGKDNTVQVWDASTGQRVLIYRGHSDWVTAVAWSPNGRYLASASRDETAPVWEASTGRQVFNPGGHAGHILTVAWSPQGKHLILAKTDGTMQVWDVSAGRHALTIQGHSDQIRSIAWSPDGKRFVSASEDGTARIWNVGTERSTLTYHGHAKGVFAVAWSPDGTRIASAGLDGTVQVWTASADRSVLTYRGHSKGVYAVVWSPDGSRLASASSDRTVQIWDSASGTLVFTFREHTDGVHRVAWSPNDSRVASVSGQIVQVWQAG